MIEKKIKENCEHFFNLSLLLFQWENLDRGQYRFRSFKIVNSVVPSPCETEPYNKVVVAVLLGLVRF